jgi:hypothetical protein
VVHREELEVEHADVAALAFADLDQLRPLPVLLGLRREQGVGEPRAVDRQVRPQAQEERDGTDVVLVPVGEHQSLDVVEAVLDRAEVGQDQVDAGLVVLGEEHPAVDDEQPAAEFEDGHVAPDFADAAQRDDAQGSGGQCGRGVGGAWTGGK